MSMINDALRRASKAAKGANPSPLPPQILPPPPPPPAAATDVSPPPLPPMIDTELPAPPTVDPEHNSIRLRLILTLVLVLGVGIAGAIKFRAKKIAEAKAVQLALAAKQTHAPLATDTNGQVKPALTPVTRPPSNPVPVSPTPAVAVAPVVAPAALPAAPPVKFPMLRLQSIFYRPSNPSVMINGRTLYVSDEIQGVTVADIRPASVILVLSGQTNVLTLR